MKYTTFLLSVLFLGSLTAQKRYDQQLQQLDSKSNQYGTIAQTIWSYAELGYQEEQSSALLKETLAKEGFTIEKGVAGIPTAFIATYGSGGPTIAILAEYDALPGLSQKALPSKVSNGGRGGHACGHHVFGTASTAAAITVKKYLEKT